MFAFVSVLSFRCMSTLHVVRRACVWWCVVCGGYLANLKCVFSSWIIFQITWSKQRKWNPTYKTFTYSSSFFLSLISRALRMRSCLLRNLAKMHWKANKKRNESFCAFLLCFCVCVSAEQKLAIKMKDLTFFQCVFLGVLWFVCLFARCSCYFFFIYLFFLPLCGAWHD